MTYFGGDEPAKALFETFYLQKAPLYCDFSHFGSSIHCLFTKMNGIFIKNYKKSWHFSFKKNKFEGGMWHFKKAGLFVMLFGRKIIDGNKNDEKL
jgi:hypothetical protein